jgi:hypothetical protein
MIVDGRAGAVRELESKVGQPGLEDDRVIGREVREAVDARRERLTRSVQGTPPDRLRAVSSRGATPGVGIVSHR